MDAVTVTRLRLSARRQCKVLVFRHVRGNVRTEGDGEIATFAAEPQANDDDAGPTMLEHEFTVAGTVLLDEIVRYGYDPQGCPLLCGDGARRNGPRQTGERYSTLAHPVVRGG